MGAMMQVDADRLWSDLMTLGAIGALPRGGCDRLALTDADRDGRNLFVHWCREANLAISIDAIGNTFARRDGSDPSLPPVFAGSHLDTQSPGAGSMARSACWLHWRWRARSTVPASSRAVPSRW
jgi:beta-ureidopropionase / N-carbamoyl-L-amino-acid hydrolase